MPIIHPTSWKTNSANFAFRGFSEVHPVPDLWLPLVAILPGTMDRPRAVFLLTGIMASGKSTVAQLLAERFPGPPTFAATPSGG